MSENDKTPLRIAYERRNRDLDPQLVWRGKDEQDEADLVVQAPPLYIQEKIHPKVLIDDLNRESRARARNEEDEVPDLFADFNGLPNLEARTEFYQHDQNWSNRMILGDSLQAIASLAEREGLRGKVQCVYVDPPYGIKFNSNFQWSTASREVKDGKREHIPRQPEQVRAFRDTWRNGIHSYLTHLRDRLTVARSLLSKSGSVFVQIGDENVHRIRSVMDEVFGEDGFVALIGFAKTSGSTDDFLGQTTDYLVWYCRDKTKVKYRPIYHRKVAGLRGGTNYNRVRDSHGRSRPIRKTDDERTTSDGLRTYTLDNLTSQSVGRDKGEGAASWFGVSFEGLKREPPLSVRWKTNAPGMARLKSAGRLEATRKRLGYVRYLEDFPAVQITNRWDDVGASFMANKTYVVQTSQTVVRRCILMTTDPGDVVLDPTCGSGTTAHVAEQWGRRWITIDTSRVALALARARIMGARYPYYLLADSQNGQLKAAELSGKAPSTGETYGDIRQGFVYEQVRHVTLRSIVNNAEIDAIYERLQRTVESALVELNAALSRHALQLTISTGARQGTTIQFDVRSDRIQLPSGDTCLSGELLEWEVPSEPPGDWPEAAIEALARFWEARMTRQGEIDASIEAHADLECLYDKPYEDKGIVRVAGPFTVESLTPHRVIEAERSSAEAARTGVEAGEAPGEYDAALGPTYEPPYDFRAVILDQLRTAGVQQADRRSKIEFSSLVGWPGDYVCAEGRYLEGQTERRAGILIGPEHGTVGRGDLMAAAREAGEAGFDVLIGCAFNYDAQSTDVSKLGRLPILKARMNADLQMSMDLKKTKTGNLFVVFGEPDIEVRELDDGQVQVRISGVDLFDPQTGDVRSSEADDLACWFIDTDYDMASFFVRHAYFLGANAPYKDLKSALKAEVDTEAWESLHSDTSRPFSKPSSGRIAVKAINHLGDEVMKVVSVP